MAGRPPTPIGGHGKIKRIQLDKGLWVARCRYRDSDGVTRIVERRSPTNTDQHGKFAEDALLAALKQRRAPGVSGDITLDTTLASLVEQHLRMLEENGKSPATLTTYRSAQRRLVKFAEQIRVGDATPGRMNAVIRSLRAAHGANMARHGRTLLRGALQIAVLDDVLNANPILQISRIEGGKKPVGARSMDGVELKGLLDRIVASELCQAMDLVDPVILLMATGLRRSELLALRWVDFDAKKGMVIVAGKLVRVGGAGLKRFDSGKTDSAARTVPLPGFAVTALQQRKAFEEDWRGSRPMIFPSTAGSWRDPDNFNKQWRKVRDELGVPDVTSHSFRKSLATLIDEEGLSARIGADQLGHSKVSMTQDRYMKRGKIHSEVADMLDRAFKSELGPLDVPLKGSSDDVRD